MFINSRLRFSAQGSERSLPQLMRTAGFNTGGFLSNPYAYYLAKSLGSGFDVLPEPHFQGGGLQYLWAVTTPLHQNSGIGSRIDEYFDLENLWNDLGRMPDNLSMRFRPVASFEHAREVLAELPGWLFPLGPLGNAA